MEKKKEKDGITIHSLFDEKGKSFEEIIEALLEQEITIKGITIY